MTATMPEGWGAGADDADDVDVEITFTPGLSESRAAEETTLEAYQRKMREKKSRIEIFAKTWMRM